MSKLIQESTKNSKFDENRLQELSKDMIRQAKQLGASDVEVGVSINEGFSVSVRLGEVETVEFHCDKAIGVTVYFGHKKGVASSGDTSAEAVKKVVEKACYIAKYTNEDPYTGIADSSLMAYDYPNLDLYHPWGLDTEQGIKIALACEQHALAFDKRITNSEGASLSTGEGYRVYANSHGFMGAYPSSRHTLSCVLIAGQDGEMQRDYSFTVARDANDLKSTAWLAQDAANRTLRRLGAHKLSTRKVPVLFAAEIAGSLFSQLLAAIRGSSIYRRSSFLVDQLEKSIFPPFVHIYEQPHLLKGLYSAPFDDEGVLTKQHTIVENGILKSYILSSYSARKLGMQTTGNAGGVHNIIVDTSNLNLADLMREMGTGLLVTELIGQGVNIVTGDYSRGAAGFWVENGLIQYPVQEITIAGNLSDMFKHLVKIGNDIEYRGSIQTGSILLEQMTIAGH